MLQKVGPLFSLYKQRKRKGPLLHLRSTQSWDMVVPPTEIWMSCTYWVPNHSATTMLGGRRKAKQPTTNRQVAILGQSLPMFNTLFMASRDMVERLEVEAGLGLCGIERCQLLATTHYMVMERWLMVGANSSCGRAHDLHPIDLCWNQRPRSNGPKEHRRAYV